MKPPLLIALLAVAFLASAGANIFQWQQLRLAQIERADLLRAVDASAERYSHITKMLVQAGTDSISLMATSRTAVERMQVAEEQAATAARLANESADLNVQQLKVIEELKRENAALRMQQPHTK